ncbi:MAG TPA: bifunctional (p)ppGpp synthetase/guanosine-3',5'-bis(diphosphate) 3'-pyrophosphohydrolase, partial [Epsilonproteobacteria bacterium]|nr:bifunctional (p)ppGpp synthetase/guanosine-3',5'-bis(diphosphate) 3'-pyrophosphohydrolase [Campylobacterota bacterium]
MNQNCKLLDNMKNTKLLNIYEDGCTKVEIEYEKEGYIETLLIHARVVASMGHYHQKFELSKGKIKGDKKPVSLELWDIESIKSIQLLRLTPAYDELHKIEMVLESKNGNLLKLTIERFDDDEEEKYYTISQSTLIFEPICQELFSVESYKKHLVIALKAHSDQKTPHGLPYSFHIISVATEIINALPTENISNEEANIAIACALLHDVLEDTTYPLLDEELHPMVLAGVQALTKDTTLPKEEQISDSIERLQKLPRYIQMVKLADRITNLGIPPSQWSKEKMKQYQAE